MASVDDDINSGVVTRRLRALSADMPQCVLVVDDDELERALIADRLAERGIDTLQAADRAGVDDYLTKLAVRGREGN